MKGWCIIRMFRDLWEELDENGKGILFILGCFAAGAIFTFVTKAIFHLATK